MTDIKPPHRSAFLSVLKPPILMDVLKYEYHIDIFHLEPGQRWEQQLYEFIEKDEVFLLFWSEAASQ